jgi:hypothetical protein
MKATAAAAAAAAAATLLALATLTSGAPAPRRVRRQAPNPLDVINSVNSWTNDVIQVNSFLDSAASLSGDALATAALTAHGFASDEPIQLMFEAGLPGLSQAGLDAAADLMQVFQTGVLDQLQNIISDPTNTDLVAGSINVINQSRCTRVLPDVDVLWPAAFAALNISPPPLPAQREAACAAITGA